MKESFVHRLFSRVHVRIHGKKVDRFLNRLMSHKIELLNITYLNRDEIEIEIYNKDYDTVVDIKSIYELDVTGYGGLLKIKKVINYNFVFLMCLLFGLALLLFLSNIIFSVEVVHNNPAIRSLLLKELENYGLCEKRFKKSFSEVEEIKKIILEKHRDQIEWLEIENIGTKYVVKVEERKIPEIKKEYKKQHVVSKKAAVIKKVIASNGVILRNIDDYVKPGDIIISGEVTLNEEVKDSIKAEGIVYGEVWYNIKVEYPFIYREEKETGKKKDVYAFKLFNHYIELFNFNKYRDKKTQDEVILGHSFLPFSFVKQRQKEVELIEYVSTEEEATSRALERGRKQMESQLRDKEFITFEKQLQVDIKDSRIVLDIFYAVYEDITDYQEIQLTTE